MTTSAYNFGNKGSVSKILRTKDLTRWEAVLGLPVLGMEAVGFGVKETGLGLSRAVGVGP